MTAWLVGSALIIISLLVAIAGITRLLSNYKSIKLDNSGHQTHTPFLASILFITGYLSLPVNHSWWALLFLLLDLETTMTMICIPYLLYLQSKSEKS